MIEIKNKIKELLAFNEVEPVYSFGSTDPNSLDNIMEKQENIIGELKELARANDTVLGRIIKFGMGDGYALYVITKVNKRTVEITWIKYCDAWQDQRAGYCSNLNIDYAKQQVKGEDAMEKLFPPMKRVRTSF